MNDNLNSILNLLDTATEQTYIEGWIPSIHNTDVKYIKIKPLNFNQQKALIKTALEQKNLYASYNFTEECFNIIKNNVSVSSNINLNILDKIFILLLLRINLQKNYNINDKQIDLYSILDILKNTIINNYNIFSPKIINYNNITITVDIPNLDIELICEKVKEELFLSVEDNTIVQDFFHKLIIDTIADELVKFIKYLEIDNNSIDMNSLSYKERKELIEKLPTALLAQALQYITDYKNNIDMCLLVQDDIYIQLDGSFFTVI